MSDFSLKSVGHVGTDLVRPECVLTSKAGNVYVSDFRGGVTQIQADGQQRFFGGTPIDGLKKLQPNGICMLKDGSFLAAHLGQDSGGIYRIYRDNRIEPFLTHIDGIALPPSNFIFLDHQGRLWLTVSTRQAPRSKGYCKNVSDGFIALIDAQGARIVADGIGYTNEVYVTRDGSTLYANATFSRETLAFDITPNNDLTHRRCVAQYGKGIFPDGLTMDVTGHLWITSIVSNSILKVDPISATVITVLQDADAAHIDWVEQAFIEGVMGPEHLAKSSSQVLKNISSLAFGAKDRKTMFLGCLQGESICTLAENVTGEMPAHWAFDEQ